MWTGKVVDCRQSHDYLALYIISEVPSVPLTIFYFSLALPLPSLSLSPAHTIDDNELSSDHSVWLLTLTTPHDHVHDHDHDHDITTTTLMNVHDMTLG